MKLRASTLVLLASLAVAACGTANADNEQDAQPDAAAQPAADQDPALPAGAETVRERLESSPRHAEYVMIPVGGGDSIRAYVVYPERSTPAPVVLVVHEIYGLTAWIRGVADQLAADGFVAIAPDLLTGRNIPNDETGDPVRDSATAAIRSLDPAVYHPQLIAVAQWGMSQPAATDSYGIVGFCWGGGASFRHAIESTDVDAAVVYYGTSPDTTLLARVNAPVLGLYGGEDARVNATVGPAVAVMERLGKTFETHTFDGAGHGFLRQQDGRDGANMAATRLAWPLTIRFFREHLPDAEPDV